MIDKIIEELKICEVQRIRLIEALWRMNQVKHGKYPIDEAIKRTESGLRSQIEAMERLEMILLERSLP